MEWQRNSAAEILVSSLRKYHSHVDEAEIIVLSGPLNDKFGRARRPRDNELALVEATGGRAPDYVIEVDYDAWEHHFEPWRLALLDHEMCHFAGRKEKKDGTLGPWKLNRHDIEEFGAVVKRHGLWREDLRAFVDLANQVRKEG